jgi:two-component system phosphate regulon response regulator OmpR
MLTAKGETKERIEGLESGADDYLPKPFEPRELYLRIMKLIERAGASTGGKTKIVKFGDLEFNTENYQLTKNGERISLSSSEAELLHLFCSNINVPIDRFELATKFHGISERSVDVQVTRLRKKIEDDPKEPRFIQTSRGKGYVFRV